MARIPTGLCWSRHLTDPLQPYKGCQSGGGKQMHLSIEGWKQEEGGLHRGDKLKCGVYLPAKVSWTANCLAWLPRYKHHTVWMLLSHFPFLKHAFNKHIIHFLCWEEQHTYPLCIKWKYIGEHYQSRIMTSVLNQSQMDTQLSSSHAKQEAYWAELHRANESLRGDLPAGLEPTPLGTERSVVSSMPPNEMHRVIWLTICILLQASRACDGDARPDMKMSCRSTFNSSPKRRHVLPPVCSWWGIFHYMIKNGHIKLCSAWCLCLESWRWWMQHSTMKTNLQHAIINFFWKAGTHWSLYQQSYEHSAKQSFREIHLNRSTKC